MSTPLEKCALILYVFGSLFFMGGSIITLWERW